MARRSSEVSTARISIYLVVRPHVSMKTDGRRNDTFLKNAFYSRKFEKAIVANSSERMKKRKIFDKPKQYLILPGIGLWFTANLPSYNFKALAHISS